jgi:hypothetical protein
MIRDIPFDRVVTVYCAYFDRHKFHQIGRFGHTPRFLGNSFRGGPETSAEIGRLKKGGDVHFLIDQFQLAVGDAGFFTSAVKIRQVISPGMVLAGYPDDAPYILSGINTSGLTDDKLVWLRQAVAVTGTEKYTTVLGAGKTVLRVDVVPQIPDLDEGASEAPPPKQRSKSK